jgi:hypothetical protein
MPSVRRCHFVLMLSDEQENGNLLPLFSGPLRRLRRTKHSFVASCHAGFLGISPDRGEKGTFILLFLCEKKGRGMEIHSPPSKAILPLNALRNLTVMPDR